jgi:hypothetical protein
LLCGVAACVGTDAARNVDSNACPDIDLKSDPQNCGACGKVCPPAATCSGSVCQCPGGTEPCGATCAEFTSDPANCGACGNVCSQTGVCLAGRCAESCETLTLCGQACVDLQASPLHCGECNNVCPRGHSCSSGVCACPLDTSACETGCFDLSREPSNCGACGARCGFAETCVGGVCTCTVSVAASFSGHLEPIFRTSCLGGGCHGGVRPQAGLNLSLGQAYADLVGVSATQCGARKRVTPGRPGQSYLVDKLTGVGMCFGTLMPKADAPLPQAELDAITSWICAGAPDN